MLLDQCPETEEKLTGRRYDGGLTRKITHLVSCRRGRVSGRYSGDVSPSLGLVDGLDERRTVTEKEGVRWKGTGPR